MLLTCECCCKHKIRRRKAPRYEQQRTSQMRVIPEDEAARVGALKTDAEFAVSDQLSVEGRGGGTPAGAAKDLKVEEELN